MDVAKEIRVALAEKGWSRAKLAEQAGLSEPCVYSALRGGRIMPASAQAIIDTLFADGGEDADVARRARIFRALCLGAEKAAKRG